MARAELFAFEDQAGPAGRLAHALGAPLRIVDLHRFPDGELLPVARAQSPVGVIYASLDHPNEKLIALALAADGLRRDGCRRLVLVAPYLCYMRQDKVFHPGEPLSRDVICGLLGGAFDRVVTVEAHMHRTAVLSAAFGGAEADDLSAAEPLAGALSASRGAIVVGPDAESEPLTRRVADRLGAKMLVFRKQRRGDAEVALDAPDLGVVSGGAAIIVDDICSSGATLAAIAQALAGAGAATIDVGVAHALFDAAAEARLVAAGVRKIISTDSVAHPTNAAPLASLLASALRSEFEP